MAYKYQALWDEIKRNRTAEITLSRELAPTVIQGVKRTKSAENVGRSEVGLIRYSKLVIEKELLSERTGRIKVKFKLLYDTRL